MWRAFIAELDIQRHWFILGAVVGTVATGLAIILFG